MAEVKRSIYAPHIGIEKGAAAAAKSYIQDYFVAQGWIPNFKIDPTRRPLLDAFHPDGVLVHVHLGTIERAFYDLMKMQFMFAQQRCEIGVLILPSAGAVKAMGAAATNADRVRDELEFLYTDQIRLPLLILSFE